ncbi:class I SAM-dependent methyltransferase [Paenibacillus tyrfis]|uniref:class I SAM-dependent methyltransferase n=1 Tax=Paenibacillus tyrfis TaxID=1501230 RepID=UPI00209CA3E5|nr:class I SAM-dependent methyltransferase [Paenibacillus tyrfis]MCP1310751.1 class I SAM-dependent methyltransferase [Paenibacillus tyrfis]
MLKDISKYWTSSSDGYDKAVKAQFRSRRTVSMWTSLLNEGLGGREGQTVLDMGTGPGFFSILLSKMGHRVTAVDASQGMIETASRNFKASGVDVKAYLGDAARLHAEKDNAFDAVVCRDVVWTLPDPYGAYAEWYRVLKPGGTLIVFDGNYLYREEPEKPAPFNKLWYALGWTLILLTELRVRSRSDREKELLGKLPFVQVLRPEADQEALQRAGFRIQEIRRDFTSGYKMTMQHLKYGYQSERRFMIIAKKEQRDDHSK